MDSLAGAVRDLLTRECSTEHLRAAWDSDSGRVPGLWKRLAELGVPALTVPETAGGLGLTDGDAIPVLETAGRFAVPEPLVGTYVGAALLAEAGGPLADEWLPQVAEGSAVVAVGAVDGLVLDAQRADLLLLVTDDAVLAVAATDVTLTAEPSVDSGVRLARVGFDMSRATRLDVEPGRAYDRGALATAAQLVGLAQGLLDQAVAYATTREQFGKPIGSFQSLKHALADVHIGIEFARPVMHEAAASLARRDVSHAKHAAIGAARRAARTALQVHGAIGYTFEHDLHMWLKRVWTLTPLWGDDATHLARARAEML